MEREDYTTSELRAKKYKGFSYTVENLTKTFQWNTGVWHWLPKVIENTCPTWNPTGGPALPGLLRRVYWLRFGWATMVVSRKDGDNGGA